MNAENSVMDPSPQPQSTMQTWGALVLWTFLFMMMVLFLRTETFLAFKGVLFDAALGAPLSLMHTATYSMLLGTVAGAAQWFFGRFSTLMFRKADTRWLFLVGVILIVGASFGLFAVDAPSASAGDMLGTFLYQIAGLRIATYRGRRLSLNPRGKAALAYWLLAAFVIFVLWGDFAFRPMLIGALDEWTIHWIDLYEAVLIVSMVAPLVIVPLLFKNKGGEPTLIETWPDELSYRLFPLGLIAAFSLVLFQLGQGLPPVFATSTDAAFPAGEEFQDCAECPVMVIVPTGNFVRGAAGEGERLPQILLDQLDVSIPQRPINATGLQQVRFTRPFAVGKFEITFNQWDACVRDGFCDGTAQEAAGGDAGWDRGNRPVIFVDWASAQQYADWLSQKTGDTYRLLRDVEWEYVAKAGTETNFPWGDEAGEKNMNYKKGDEWPNTAPVGSFPPNAFGLHDMHGNVWEWTATCEKSVVGDCPKRIVRGGSWYNDEFWQLESAARFFFEIDIRQNFGGFRVMKELQ